MGLVSAADTPDPALDRIAALACAALRVPAVRIDREAGGTDAPDGCAAVPIIGAGGETLGILRANDPAGRRWSGDDLRLLAGFADACADVLVLRDANAVLQRRKDLATAQGETADAAFDHSQLLLRASVALAGTGTAEDVAEVVRDLVTSTLDPAYVGIAVTGEQAPVTDGGDLSDSAAATPAALAARAGRPVLLADLDAVHTLAPHVAEAFVERGWQSATSVPLPGPDGPVGALTFAWKQPHLPDAAEQTVLAALAGYVAQALRRADYLSSRENAAMVLQTSLLSALPDAAPFQLAARYEPASRGEHVGGDWYDAVTVSGDRLAVVVGDVTGHDMRAAARMGRLRSKLRLLLVDRRESPAALLHRLDTASKALNDLITATAVLAYLEPAQGRNGHRLSWSNAGHPNPLLITGSGARPLTGHDPLLGLRTTVPRTGHSCHLPPGATVLFYTDGLIETRQDSLEERERRLWEVAAAHAATPLPELLDRLYAEFAGDDHEDDVAMIAVRTPRA